MRSSTATINGVTTEKVIPSPQRFLQRVENAPKLLVEELCDSVKAMVEKYEYEHPVGQTKTTDGILKQLLFYTNKKVIEDEFVSDDICVENNYYRRTYLELCGLLYQSHHSLSCSLLDRDDDILTDLLEQLCRSTNIAKDGNLPANWVLEGENSKSLFHKKLRRKPGVVATLESEYADMREKLFKRLGDYVHNGTFLLNTNYHAPVGRIIKALDEERYNLNFDLKFAVTVLKSTYHLIDSKPPSTSAEYCHLASFAPGASSTGQLLMGLMLGLAASCLIAFGIMCGFYTGGVASFASTYMITTGMQALSIAGTLIPTVAGTYGLVKSVGIFKESVRHGLAKDMVELAAIRDENCITLQPIS